MKVNRILHGKSNCPKMHAPRQVKMTLIWYLLPHLVPKQRSLPVIAQLAPEKTIHCHALAVAKKREGSYETVALSTDKGNRRVEHLKLAHVSGEKWVVHPGTSLSPSLLFVTVIPEECSQSKRRKSSSKPVIVDKIEPIKEGEALSKLFAVANHIAEVQRAEIENREVDIEVAHALFDKSLPQTKIPKKVFVLWKAIGSGSKEHVSEVVFKTLFHRRV